MSDDGPPNLDRYIPLMYKQLLQADLRIHQIKGTSTQSKKAMIRIDKISSKSLRFSSELLFPVTPQITYSFQVVILNETIGLFGFIKWRQKEERLNFFEVELIIDDATRNKLNHLLKNLARKYMPAHMKAEYYYHYFADSTYDFKNSRINLLI